ncbi:NAD(P)H-dependent oxidoreductase subunit E [bacterium]|nr:NAD(P)H-dependent oxidoreductase subunit E [bacterium]MBU1993594.1 NAD(P)H-dependent oxidoreductase subunit E [bacterium]
MSFSFSEENNLKIASLMKRYPQKKALILPLLWMAQKQDGYISEDAMQVISEHSHMPYMHVYSVATFYTMFRLQKPTKRVIEVCRTLSCELRGSQEIKKHLLENYSDSYEIVEVECMGACSGAPMCTLDGKYLENLTPRLLDEVLNAN